MHNKRRPKPEPKPPANYIVSWGENSDKISKQFSDSLDSYRTFSRTEAFSRNDFSNLDTQTSSRPGLRWRDYDAFRPDEARPEKHQEILFIVDEYYRSEGIIRNIIDLMGDFACQGIRLVHPNKKIEKFFRNWFSRVKGKERSERFLNYLYKSANVVVRVQTAKISLKMEEQIYKSCAETDIDIKTNKQAQREIPWKYTFLHPATVSVIGGPLASFVGNPRYAIKLPTRLSMLIKSPKNQAEKELIAKLPKEIKQAAKTNNFVLLPEDKTRVFHYKKDDWDEWALPMIYSIIEDLATLKKLKLADRAALDGAISNIRVWKIGNLEHKVPPSPQAAALLSDMLENNTGVGTIDIVWGPDIDLLESNTNVHQFLGEGKYKPTMNNIYAGLGIPPTLTGTYGAAGTTNNFISLKTLTQRLQYGRNVLKSFWEEEISKVQQAMGFRFPAKVEFDETNLADEDAQKSLLIQLADRNLVSDERIQEVFKIEPEMEKLRLNRENREREGGRMVPKAGQFHDPQFGIALKKLVLQTGVGTPSQVGLSPNANSPHLKMYEKDPDEKPALEMRTPNKVGSNNKSKSPSFQKKDSGRPKTVQDTSKRSIKKFTPRSKAVIEIWADYTQVAIAKALHDDFLKLYNKKNLRSLSSKEVQNIEDIKFDILYHLEPLSEVDYEHLFSALQKGPAPIEFKSIAKDWTSIIQHQLGRVLTIEETRKLQSSLYAEFFEDGVR